MVRKKNKKNNIPIPIAIIIAAIIISASLFITQEKDPMYLQCLKKKGYYDTYSRDSKNYIKRYCK